MFVICVVEILLYVCKVGGVSIKGKGKEEGSNFGIGGVGEEFFRGLDEWERKFFCKVYDGVKFGKEWMDSIKKN